MLFNNFIVLFEHLLILFTIRLFAPICYKSLLYRSKYFAVQLKITVLKVKINSLMVCSLIPIYYVEKEEKLAMFF